MEIKQRPARLEKRGDADGLDCGVKAQPAPAQLDSTATQKSDEASPAKTAADLDPQSVALGKQSDTGSGVFGQRSSAKSPALRGAAALPTLSQAKLGELVGSAHHAMKASGPFGSGLGTNKGELLGALSQLSPSDVGAFTALYQAQFGADPQDHVRGERLLTGDSKTRALAYLQGDVASGDAIGLQHAFDAGDAKAALGLLGKGTSVEAQDALMTAYRDQTGRDLEYDMRGFALDLKGPLDLQGLSPTIRGLGGEDLQVGFALLHGPKLDETARTIAELTSTTPSSTPAGRQEIYAQLSTLGGEARTLLDEKLQQTTGRTLIDTLRPVAEAAAADNGSAPIDSPPEKTVAVIVSSGNYQKMLEGADDKHIGGYHWREIEAYVKEALDNGFTPVIFTPDGLPPTPDALSLLQGKLGPKVGFGLREGTGLDSEQGRAIMEQFRNPRPMSSFDVDDFATMHVAGGHGSHHDLVGHPEVERAGLELHAAGKPVTAVCHATPSLGRLLEGGNATGFSPEIDAVMLKAGYVLPEFDPPYDAHQGLRDIGAKLNVIDRAQALLNMNHTETIDRPGEPPVFTGTGPEATDNVARQVFDWLLDA